MSLRVACVVLVVLSLWSVAPTGADSAGEDAVQDDAPRWEPGLIEQFIAGDGASLLVHFNEPIGMAAALRAWPGATGFERLLAVSVPAETAAALGPSTFQRATGASFIEAADKPLRFALDSARRASAAADVSAGTVAHPEGMTTQQGVPIDGRGIGIALIDTGVDPTHPDLSGRLASSWHVTEAGVFPAPNPEPLSSHGTHLAGILVGTGAVDPELRGVAPGARIHSFDIGPGATNLHAARALDWLLDHHGELDPPARLVVNGWGCHSGPCRTWDPDQAHNALASQLAKAGLPVVFPVGNEGGRGFVSTVNPEATNPTPGILGVGDHHDRDLGVRGGCVSDISAVGALTDATTWPDVVAPGAWTWSANAVQAGADGRAPIAERKAYMYLHGTSAAAAHLGGIIALGLQAAPAARPHEVEFALKSTAVKNDCGLAYVRADATHPWGATHPRQGHGLVDAQAFVEALVAGVRIPGGARPVEAPPDDWLGFRTGARAEAVLYLADDNTLVPDAPPRGLPDVLPVSDGSPAVFTSEPLLQAGEYSAARVDLWWGTFKECVCLRVNAGEYGAHLDLVRADGTVARLGTAGLGSWFVHPAGPTQRPLDLTFPATVFDVGDRVRITVAPLLADPPPVTGTHVVLYFDSAETASRIALGSAAVPREGDAVWCQVRQDCADVGGDRVVEGLHCQDAPMRVEWRGPPGSSITLTCFGDALSCSIPPATGTTEGECHAESLGKAVSLGSKTATCRYTTVDDSRAGEGRCVGLLPRHGGD